MNRFVVFGVAVGMIYAISFFSGGELSATSVCEGDKCYVGASASIVSLFGAFVLGLFIFIFPHAKLTDSGDPVGAIRDTH